MKRISLILAATVAAFVMAACDNKDGGRRRALAPTACFGGNYNNFGQYRWNAVTRQCQNATGGNVDQRFCQNQNFQNGFNGYNNFNPGFNGGFNNGFNTGYNNCVNNGYQNPLFNNVNFGANTWGGAQAAYQWCNQQYAQVALPGEYFIPVQMGHTFMCLGVTNYHGFSGFNHAGFSAAFSANYNFMPTLFNVGSGTPYIQGCNPQQDLDGDGKPACKCRELKAKVLKIELLSLGFGACTDI